jgi:BolA-like protein 1
MQGKSPIETHFIIEIASESFKGKRLIERHRMVYDVLGQELKNGLHALQIKAKTVEEASQ